MRRWIAPWRALTLLLTLATPFSLLAATAPSLVLPVDGTVLGSPRVTFLWDAEPGASAYRIAVASSPALLETPALADLFLYEGSASVAQADGLPMGGETLHVRLSALVAGAWLHRDYQFDTMPGAAVVPGSLVSPAPGTTLDRPVTTLSWSPGEAAEGYYLALGSTPQSVSAPPWAELYFYQGADLTTTTPPLELTGERIYARLWTLIGGRTYYEDVYYETRPPEAARIAAPANGSVLDTVAVTFSWDPVDGASDYVLGVGTSLDAVAGGSYGDIFLHQGPETQVTVPNVPQEGAPIHVRLWTQVDGVWLYQDHQYATAAVQPARLLSPVPGLLPGTPSVTFNWSGASGASEYMLAVATRPDVLETEPWGDVFTFHGSTTSAEALIFPRTTGALYARLWSRIGGAWYHRDYTYFSGALDAAKLTWPPITEPLTHDFTEFHWRDVGADEYAIGVGTSATAVETPEWGDVYFESMGQATSRMVSDIPLTGEPVHVRIWSRFGEFWFHTDQSLSTIESDAPPDPIAECAARGWATFSLPTTQGTRSVLVKAPAGPWTRGALAVLHGGGGHHGHWCATSGTGNSRSVDAMIAFTEAAVAEGYAVFAVDSGDDSFEDLNGLACGKRYDFVSAQEDNEDLSLFGLLFDTVIPSLRPGGSATEIFLSGLSNGGYMATRLATRFADRITAFTPVAAGDPYGTVLWCDPTNSTRENAPGVSLDADTLLDISQPDGCFATSHPNEAPWEGGPGAGGPVFKLLHHEMDPVVDRSCSDKLEAQLQAHGYAATPRHVGAQVHSDVDRNHLWQREYNAVILDFFRAVAP